MCPEICDSCLRKAQMTFEGRLEMGSYLSLSESESNVRLSWKLHTDPKWKYHPKIALSVAC